MKAIGSRVTLNCNIYEKRKSYPNELLSNIKRHLESIHNNKNYIPSSMTITIDYNQIE